MLSPSFFDCISCVIFCNKRLNARIVRFKRNWDEIAAITCGPASHRKGH
jgi:hypothetical protein